MNQDHVEALFDIADILSVPTGATPEQIAKAAISAVERSDAYAETMRHLCVLCHPLVAKVITDRHPELTTP